MRRLLILLLVLTVPLKVWASAALPLAAGTKHAGALAVQHVGHMVHAHVELPANGGDSGCCPDHHADAHSHECPHLAMPLLISAPLARAAEPGAAAPAAPAARPLGSVVLDVPLPPPLLPL